MTLAFVHKCKEPGCGREIKASGLCASDYLRARGPRPINKSVSAHYYRHDLLDWRRRVLDLSIAKVALQLNLRERTAQDVFAGKASAKQAYPIARLLGLDWAQVHNFELQESDFYSAVTNGTGHAKAKKESGFRFFRWLKRRLP